MSTAEPVSENFDYIEHFREFPLTTFQVDNHPAMPVHTHRMYTEIVIVLEGEGQHLVGEGAFALGRGDVFVVPAGMPHGYICCRGLSLINILYGTKLLGWVDRELSQVPGYNALFPVESNLREKREVLGHLKLNDEALAELIEPLRKIRQEVRGGKAGFEAASKSIFASVLVELTRQPRSTILPMSRDLVRLSPLLDWLEDHFAEPILVETLAERAQMSRSTLERLFAKCVGTSPLDYVIGLRLRKAELLLRDTEFAMADVAAAVGIDDVRYLARLFRQRVGTGPREYRHQVARGVRRGG